MKEPIDLGPEKDSLSEFTVQEQKSPAIKWYRTPIPAKTFRLLHERSDARGFLQAGGFLALLMATFGLALHSAGHWPWEITLLLVFLHGTISSFLLNGVHELGHGTVFKTKWLNRLFVHLLAFLGWINHEMFQSSHIRHHRYTLHPPDDLEVVLPMRLMIRHFFLVGIVDVASAWQALEKTVRIARGKFSGEWETTLYPEDDAGTRKVPVRWARILLAGHASIIGISIFFGWWLVPVLLSAGPFYGGWLFFLCNNTQHIGLEDNVSDFRLCCRTFTVNPAVRFLYWQMNYHTEHHMYPAVPCYYLGRLHELIKHDLPFCPNGLVAVWREIAALQVRQKGTCSA
jgi:fatty acid desaturase